MARKLSRRQAIKTLGLGMGAAALGFETLAKKADHVGEYRLNFDEVYQPVPGQSGKPITAVTLGAGNRGNVYGNYAAAFPDQIRIVGVAEPIPVRNERYAKKHSIPDENRFVTWEHVLDRPKFADAVIITMPDNLHYEPCMLAMEKGYDVLLEKPMAQTADQCRDILYRNKKTGRIVAVCHVLRYSPYFIKMKQLIREGRLGEIISVQHMEPIEHIHMSHSYVRGNWHNSVATTPIILAKSCHDLDILKFVLNRHCNSIFAMGDLKWFRYANAPAGSTERCLDGCSIEPVCPYSAKKIYVEKPDWRYVFDLPDDPSRHTDYVMDCLRKTNYGRCVYRMDNDQCDHYITNILFDGNITAAFSIEAFTAYAGRRTRVMGSMGDIVGDMEEMNISNYITGKTTKLVPKAEDVGKYKNSGHGGGDWMLMRDFVMAVANQDPKYLTSTIEESIESHIMGFAAEQSRTTGKLIRVNA